MKRYTLNDQVYDAILEMIVDGLLHPGDRVSDAVLAEQLGVSRTPVREALATLTAHGLLVRTAHHGCHVVEPSHDDLVAVFQVREANEALAARLMAVQGTDEDLAELERIHQKLLQAASEADRMAYWRHDFAFHHHILQGCGNTYLTGGAHLVALMVQFFLTADHYYRGADSAEAIGWTKVSAPEHTAIWQAIRDRDAEAAERMMRRHMRSSSARVQAASRENAAEAVSALQSVRAVL